MVASKPHARTAGEMYVLLVSCTIEGDTRVRDRERSCDSRVSIPKRCQVGKSEGRSLSVGGRLKPSFKAGKSEEWAERRGVELWVQEVREPWTRENLKKKSEAEIV